MIQDCWYYRYRLNIASASMSFRIYYYSINIYLRHLHVKDTSESTLRVTLSYVRSIAETK
jgi:hypothetical protein